MRKVLALFALTFIPFSLKAASDVDLLWQGQTYTPPFYEGRSLWSNESRVDLYAIPHIVGADLSTLYYRWSKDGTVLGSLSGINKRSITFVDTALSLPIEVKMDVRQGENGDILASRTVLLTPIGPKTLVVKDDPLYGLLFNSPIGGEFALSGPEVSFAAVPLFAAVSTRLAPAMSYTWTMNSSDSRTGNEVLYRAPEGTSGLSNVSLRVTDSHTLVQPEDKDFSIKFNNVSN